MSASNQVATDVIKEFLKNPSASEKNGAIKVIENIAESEGLSSDLIMKLISVIESNKICTLLKLKLLSLLIPKESISEHAFIRITCLLSDFQFDLKLKVEILKWMISVYTFVENTKDFLCLYEVFLNLLEFDDLRPHLCHLLYRITKKEHVTLRRIKIISALLTKIDPQPCLEFLLFILHKKHPCHIRMELRVDWKYEFEPLGIYPDLIKNVHPTYTLNTSPHYFLTDNADGIPSIHVTVKECNDTTILPETCTENERSSQLGGGNEFCEILQEFRKLEKTTDIKKIFKSQFRRLFLTSNIPQEIKTRAYDYFFASLYYNLKSFDFHDALDIFHDMQELIPAASNFTDALVEKWDGYSDLDTVTGMLSYQPICCFQKIANKLDLIREKLLKASLPVKCHLLNCLSKIYQNWILMEYNRYSVLPCDGNCTTFLSESRSEQPGHPPAHELHKLRDCIDGIICDTLVVDDNFHPCLLNEILFHYERLSSSHMKTGNLVMHLPTTSVFHAALFSLSSSTLENLCRLILRYVDIEKSMVENNNPEAKHSFYYCEQYCLDILKMFRNGDYESNINTHLSNTRAFQMLKELYPQFEKHFILYRHPALVKNIFSYCKDNRIKKLPLEINNIPDGNHDVFNYLHDDVPCFVEFITIFSTIVDSKAFLPVSL